MRIISNLNNYIVIDSASLFSCLLKIDENKRRTIFVVDGKGHLVGVLSDGDFRRWLTRTKSSDLNVCVREVMNQDFTSRHVDTPAAQLKASFDERFDLLPLIDAGGHLVSIAVKGLDGIEINGRLISQQSPSYIIAEIGNNHNGSLEHAKELVDAVVSTGVDCVKFQMRDMAALYKNQGQTQDDSADLGAQYVFNLLEKFQLSNEQLIEIFDYCRDKGITPLCTPWDDVSLNILEDYGMPAYKVASADLTNLPFLEKLAATGKPLFCSTGMSTENEIKQAVEFLNKHSAQYVLLHCNSTYPTPLSDVNLNYLNRLSEISDGLVGYSGHELGTDVAVAAVAMGARVVEKHFTLDKSMEGNDHKVSLLPDELTQMVQSIRSVEMALGNSQARELSQGEMMNRETLAKSLISKCPIKKGQAITRDMVDIKSPGQGLQPYKLDELIGKAAVRDVDAGDFFYQSDIDGQIANIESYHFDRPFGVPVRYHDYPKLKDLSNLDLIEFHLSFQDMKVDLDKTFEGQQNLAFAVHAPELFANDHIIDLASDDEQYLAISRQNLADVVKITQKLKTFFPATPKPVIVLNAGGFTDKDFLASEDRAALYDQISRELASVDQEGVEIVIQSMPPFPWHFGGQRYHNLFVDPDEIAEFCEKHNTRICLDISHAMMACNYYGWKLSDYVAKTGQYTAHLHISDASGDSGEGVQMGTGDVDFTQLSSDLKQYAPKVPFIPEIWQGHKNTGEGFWQALSYMQEFMHS